jgi:hypothetical protein
VIGGGRTPAPHAQGWNNTDVAVRFVCEDALSGVPDWPGDQSVASACDAVARVSHDQG